MIDLKEIENTIINADCMDILKELPDKSIDLVLTDPPYGQANGKIERTGGSWSKKYQLNNSIKEWDFAPDKSYFNEMFRVSENQIIWVEIILNYRLPDVLMFGVN